MKKRTLIFLAACAGIVGAIYLPKLTYVATYKPQTLTLNPAKDVFAFDLHGVVFKPDYKAMISHAFKAIDWPFVRYIATHPQTIYDIVTLRKHSSVPEEYITDVATHHPFLASYVEPAIDIANSQTPIVSTVEYIQELKQDGFRVYVFSNIGRYTFEKFKPQFEKIFALFDGYLVTEPDDNWVQKPHAKAYYKFLQTFKVRPDQVTFVDDQKNNIKGAQQVGIRTIHYQCPQDLPKIQISN